MAKEVLQKFIGKTVAELCRKKSAEMPPALDFDLVVTRDPSHGDFACNVAFKLARVVKERPNVIADELVLLMEENDGKEARQCGIARMEVAGGGFINFFLEKASLGQILVEIHKKGEAFGRSDYGKKKKVMLEFVSANPTGPLTIAHGRQAAIGDSLVRILRATGHDVIAEYYLNDAGRQMNLLGKSLWARYHEVLNLPCAMPEDGYQGAYLIDLARQLIEEKKDTLLKLGEEEGAKFCTQYAGSEIMKTIRKDLDDFRVHFDSYFSEGTLYEKNDVEKTLETLRKAGFIYEKEGAVWFESTHFGDDKDRVVKKSTGEYTYLAPDIAYHHQKFKRGFNKLINLLGPDHHGYIPRLKAACQALGHDPEEIDVRIVQLTTLYRNGQPVRMSTRAGEFVTLRELLDEAGIDAGRFFFVMRRVESHLDFDLDLAKQKSQENPVYYLQYAHARIASLLKFAERPVTTKVDLELLKTEQETNLIKILSNYPKVLIHASEVAEPYGVADYLRDVAMMFHKFYSIHRIVTEDEELTKARLLLADAARIVLRNGLDLLGISQPESM